LATPHAASQSNCLEDLRASPEELDPQTLWRPEQTRQIARLHREFTKKYRDYIINRAFLQKDITTI